MPRLPADSLVWEVGSSIRQIYLVNVTGTILCCREAVRRMSTRRGGEGGAIVNISSTSWRTGGTGEWVAYAASKGAVNTFTIGLAREVADEGIRVNAVAPGLVETGLHAANGRPERLARLSPTIPMGQQPAAPLEIAEGVAWLLSWRLLTPPARYLKSAAAVSRPYFRASSISRFCSSAWRLAEPTAGLALRTRPAY